VNAFVSAQLTDAGLKQLEQYAHLKFGGWGYTGKKLPPEELVVEAKDCEIMVICYEEINDYVLDNLPKLKMIACSRGGVENIDKAAVKRHSVLVSSAPGRNANAVAELALGLMIGAMRFIPQTHHYIKSRQWERVPWDIAGNTGFKTFEGGELAGKTLGLIGFGIIARRVARLASGFDMDVIAYDPYLPVWPENVNVKKVGWEEVLGCSDVVSLHCKLTPETKGMIDAKALRLMKKNGILINTARGGLVDEQALYEALRDKRISSAALDVLIDEPMKHDHPFLELDNIILTPHIGGASRDIIAQQSKIVLEDIESFFKCGKLVHAIA
jgi:D-3-phosphoglycerate dehydrogenase / 2-oxoglutarate reductase